MKEPENLDGKSHSYSRRKNLRSGVFSVSSSKDSGGTLDLSARATYVNAITRKREDERRALSRIAIASRGMYYTRPLSRPRAEKSENLIRLICNFVAPGVLQITYTPRELTLSCRGSN